MIQILNNGGLYTTVILCDYCRQRIEDAELGVAIAARPDAPDGEMSDVLHVHKGDCRDAVERRFFNDINAGSAELTNHLLHLILNTNLTPQKLHALQKLIEEIGM